MDPEFCKKTWWIYKKRVRINKYYVPSELAQAFEENWMRVHKKIGRK